MELPSQYECQYGRATRRLRMSLGAWPFRPNHITNDGGPQARRAELRTLVGTGIIPNRYLQGHATSISNILQEPTTIMEFPLAPEGKPVRTDSRSPRFGHHPHCSAFRQETGSVFCDESDMVHAALFRGGVRKRLSAQIYERARQSPYICSYREDPETQFRLVDHEEHP